MGTFEIDKDIVEQQNEPKFPPPRREIEW